MSVSLEYIVGAAESDHLDRKVAYLMVEGRIESDDVTLRDEQDECAWVERSELKEMEAEVCPRFRQFACDYGPS